MGFETAEFGDRFEEIEGVSFEVGVEGFWEGFFDELG